MNKIILAAVLAAAATFAGTANADESKPESRAGVEKENARFNRSKNLSAKDIQTIIDEKSAGHAKRAAEMSRAAEARLVTSPFTGIIEAEDIPNPFRADELTIVNYWGGQTNGKPIGVYSGYRPSDPSRGVLVVFDDAKNTRGTDYEMPSAPMAIAAELNGTLTLQSRGQRVVFDLATRTFH